MKETLWFCFLSCLSLTIGAQSNYFQKGLECFENDDLVCASEQFQKAYDKTKSDSSLLHLAWVNFELEDDMKAIQQLESLIKKSPSYEDAVLLLHTVHKSREDYKSSSRVLTKYIETYPLNCRCYQARAQQNAERWGFDEAVKEDLELSLYSCNDKEVITSLLMLGQTYYELEQYEPANNVYDELLELAPNNPDVVFDVAAFKADVGQFDQAEDMFLKYQQLVPEDSTIYFQLGYCALANENYSLAVETLTTALKTDSSNADIWYNRGLANAAANSYDFAIRDLSQSRELDPELDEATYNLALVYQNKSEYKKAIQLYTEYLLKHHKATLKPGTTGDTVNTTVAIHMALVQTGKKWNVWDIKKLWKTVRSLCNDD